MGIITTYAGNGTAGYTGDGGAATAATLNQPINVATDIFGNLFIVDFNNSVIRKVNSSKIISTVAGTGTPGFSGDGGAATSAKLYHPTMAACDLIGNLYIDDENNDRIRKVNTSGIITTIAGDGIDSFSGDGGPATIARLNETYGVCVDKLGNVFIADLVNERIRIINSAGIITTFCGTGVRGALGDGGPSTAAQLYNPYGICVDDAGNLYISDNINERIRKVSACPTIGSITGIATVCPGSSTTLSDVTTGGTWSSSNISVATVGSSTGTVIGIAAGTATISYILYGFLATKLVTVNSTPAAISGGTTVAIGGMIILTDIAPGGFWMSADTAVAKVCDSCGFVRGISTGSSTISYSIGSCYVTTTVNVITLSSITGTTSLCTGASIGLSDATTGGTWVSSNSGVATVGLTTGTLTGVAAGTATITYLADGGLVTTTVTIHATPSAIIGSGIVATGGAITLNDVTTGGVWTSSNPSIAEIGSITGIVTGVAAGTSLISYDMGVCYVTLSMNVIPIAAIIGATTLCFGTSSALSDATTGGTWSSSDTLIATVNATSGVVYGISAGTAIISYNVAGYSRTILVTIIDVPIVGAISGFTMVAVDSAITLRDFNSGGAATWSSSNSSIASVNTLGVVTGISNGNVIITYSVTNSCATTNATIAITVYTGITGDITICTGGTTTLIHSLPGSIWSSSDTSIATINSGTGVLTGISAGTAYLTYTMGSPFIVTVTVLPLPSVTGTVTNVSCSGYTNGNIGISVTGGSTRGSWLFYSYLWSNGAITNGAWDLIPGNYSVIVTDPDGCSGTATFTVTAPTPLIDSGIITDTLLGCIVGKIELMVSGGTSPYTYNWSNGESSQDIYGLLEGEYIVTIKDSNNCEATGWYYVEYCDGCHQDGMRRSNPSSVTQVVQRDMSVKAYPNPFFNKTNITFTTTTTGQTTVEVISAVDGEKIGRIFNEYTIGGSEHSCVLNGDNLSQGIYIYIISVGNVPYFGKVVLVK